jgi:lysophospholipase L1-like esterase
MSSQAVSISPHMEPEEPTEPPVTAPCRGCARVMRKLGRDLLIIVVILAAVEIVLRFVGPEYERNLYDHDYTGSQLVDLNAEGYRGPAVPLAKQPGEFRLVCLGDSTTFGTGVGSGDTWPAQLGDLLRQKTSRPVSTMNVAFEGASLRTLDLAYRNQWAAYKPDVVALLVSGNMISLSWMQRNSQAEQPRYGRSQLHETRVEHFETELNRAFHKLRLPAFLSLNTQRGLYWLGVLNHNISPQTPTGAMLAHGWREGGLDPAEAQEAWKVFARDLTLFHDDVAAHGAVLVVEYVPTRFDLSDSAFDNEKNVPRDRLTISPDRRFADLCSRLGIPLANGLEAIRQHRAEIEATTGHRASMYIAFDYAHLDHDGHFAVARAMADYLGKSGPFLSDTSR